MDVKYAPIPVVMGPEQQNAHSILLGSVLDTSSPNNPNRTIQTVAGAALNPYSISIDANSKSQAEAKDCPVDCGKLVVLGGVSIAATLALCIENAPNTQEDLQRKVEHVRWGLAGACLLNLYGTFIANLECTSVDTDKIKKATSGIVGLTAVGAGITGAFMGLPVAGTLIAASGVVSVSCGIKGAASKCYNAVSNCFNWLRS